MSQSGTAQTGGGGGGGIDQIDANTGSALPVGGVINLVGDDSTTNNTNGIYTEASGMTVTVYLSNRLEGTGQTVGAVTDDLITFSLGGTAGVFTIQVDVAAFESSTPAGAGYSIFGTVRTTGAAATLIGTPDKIVNEEAALTGADCNLVVSGNNVILRATGVAAVTIDWNSVGYYVRRI